MEVGPGTELRCTGSTTSQSVDGLSKTFCGYLSSARRLASRSCEVYFDAYRRSTAYVQEDSESVTSAL